MPNATEYRSKIGLDSLYYAEVTADTSGGYTAGATAWLAPAAEATQEPNVSSQTQYADDLPYEVMTQEGETKISLKITGLPMETLATLLGKTFDAASGRIWDSPDAVAPYFALGFRSMKANGHYRYYWFLKGKFELPKEDHKTKADKPDPQVQELVFVAIPTIYKFNTGSTTESIKRVAGDQDATNFSATGWFTAVQTPSWAPPAALSATYDPLDGAAGVAVNKTITITFNNAVQDDAIYRVVVTDAAGTLKACTNSLDATKKILTVDPDTNFAGGTTYIVTVGVVDVFGDTLMEVINFGTI